MNDRHSAIGPFFSEIPPLSLYIHIPWCIRKCPYCDFNSHSSDNALPENEYANALIEDLTQELMFVYQRPLKSIFFGGGTPSIFSADTINNILARIAQLLEFDKDIEITLEANPGTVDQNRFLGYRQAGVNRISIGIQSFDTQHLKQLGRIHDCHQAISAVSCAKQAGFANINIDIMHGLPGQNAEQALADLAQAVALSPTHISWYQLTIEPNTAFYNSPPILPSDNQLADIQLAGEQKLASNSFTQYEVSAFCQQHKQSQHNMGYWQFADYIGIGAGAHAKLTLPEQQSIIRRWKTRMPNHYLDTQREFCAGQRTLSREELPLEFMMNALRLNDGFSIDMYQRRTGLPFATIEQTVKRLVDRRLLRCCDSAVRTTAAGRRFLNDVLLEF